MTGKLPTLPANFEVLTPFVSKWVRNTENERREERHASSYEEITLFYNTMLPMMKDVLTLLQKFKLDDMTPQVHQLFLLALAFAEISDCVEQFSSVAVPDSFSDASRLIPTHTNIYGIYDLANI